MSDTEKKIADDIKTVIELVDRRLKFVHRQVPTSEEHDDALGEWEERLQKQKEHLEKALKEVEDVDNDGYGDS